MLKNAFERTRPEFADAFLLTPSWSFPSGHAMNTFVFCGLGVYVLLRFTRSWTMMGAVVAVAFAWCLVMGFTRLYLGVHFLSDVVAGLIAATAWVAVCVSGIAVALRRSNRA
jgi:undecaprenyl-diphosphatase